MSKLIDANALIDKLNVMISEAILYHTQIPYALIRELISEQPTIDAEPVRRGRWIPTEYDSFANGAPVWDKWECSECGHEHNGEEDTLPAFCQDCGTYMREGGVLTMAALLERDALISEIDKEIDFYDDSKHQDDKFITLGIKIARKLVKKYPAVNQWIPCSERLPKTDTPVICYMGIGKILVMELSDDDGWYCEITRYNPRAVTHWMPLPEPPKE